MKNKTNSRVVIHSKELFTMINRDKFADVLGFVCKIIVWHPRFYMYSETPPYGHLGNTVTSFYGLFVLGALQNGPTFSCKKKPSLIRPNFFGPLVTVYQWGSTVIGVLQMYVLSPEEISELEPLVNDHQL